MTLVSVGIASLAIAVAFTVWAAFAQSSKGGQTIRHSIEEAWTNLGIGFSINYVANMVILPLAGFPVSAGGAFWIGCIFTAISILRQFVLRRIYNRKMLRAAR